MREAPTPRPGAALRPPLTARADDGWDVLAWPRAGKLFVYWYGSEPRLCLTDAAMIKEFLSSKYAASATGKSWLQRQGTRHFIGRGLLMANGARWSHQRHVVAPAFMADKLKVRRRRHRRRSHSVLLLPFFRTCRRLLT